MKRILLLSIVAAVIAPAGAHAATPCRDKIYNEWYSTGKISSSYPLSCYRDALKHIPPDAKVYSNLGGDIRAAMQIAVGRSNNPGGGGSTAAATVTTTPSANPIPPHGVAGNSTTTTSSSRHVPVAIAPLSSSHGGGVPLAILVLGAIAIVLALAGLVGTGVQQVKRRRTA